MSPHRVVVPLVGLCALVAVDNASAQAATGQLEASLRLGLQLETEPDQTINLQDFNSRVRWNGRLDVSDAVIVTGYLEFGLDEASGLSTTRQAWIGFSSGSGTITGGKQYRAFYDATSSFTDVAYIGSCQFQIGCSRQEAVIKYERLLGDGLRLLASATMQGGDDDEDLFDELEGGGVAEFGAFTLGAIVGFRAGEGFDAARDEAGMAAGIAASTERGDVTYSTSLQFADGDYARGTDETVWLLDGAASVDRWYAVAGFEKADAISFFATVGYEYPLLDDALLFAELQVFEPEGDLNNDGFDDAGELFLRTAFVYNFGAIDMPRQGSR